ncbi:MAG: ABC transporter permease [Phycisphaerales bacterium]|nr:ABC transporter permease [Phycisphaerales bacterium]
MAMHDRTIVLRSMSGRLFSTTTTIVTVAIAVGLMTLILSMRSAVSDAFARGTGNAQMLISHESSPLLSVLSTMFYTESPSTPIMWAEYEELRGRYPFAWTVPTQLGDSFRGLPVVATTQNYLTDFMPVDGTHWALADGRVFEDAFEVVLGAQAAARSGLRIGDHIHLTHGDGKSGGDHEHEGFEYTIVGILEPTATAHDRAVITDLQSAWVVHAHDRRESELGHGITTTAADITGEDMKITGVYASLGARNAALVQVLSTLRRDAGWTVAQPADTVRKLFVIVGNIDQILVAMAAAVLLSSGVSILVALYNSMEQRRRQIAVLRVLGASRARVMNLVLCESALIGLLGGVLGVAVGMFLGDAVAGVLARRVGVVVHPSLPIDGYLWMVLSTVGLSMLAGIIPAVVAYRVGVIRALRPMG